MDNALNELFKAIGDDYLRCRSQSEYFDPKAVEEFIDSLVVEEGRKYLKIVKSLGSQRMVWGFIVKEDEEPKAGSHTFKAGDILKAASWNAPARNKPRGNIIQGDFSWVRWTGPEYL